MECVRLLEFDQEIFKRGITLHMLSILRIERTFLSKDMGRDREEKNLVKMFLVKVNSCYNDGRCCRGEEDLNDKWNVNYHER